MTNDVSNISPEENEEKRIALLRLNDELNANEDEPSADPFEADAAEGLSAVKSENLESMVRSLNANLAQQLRKKKKKKSAIPDQSGLYIVIITLLVLIVVAYIVIRKIHGTP